MIEHHISHLGRIRGTLRAAAHAASTAHAHHAGTARAFAKATITAVFTVATIAEAHASLTVIVKTIAVETGFTPRPTAELVKLTVFMLFKATASLMASAAKTVLMVPALHMVVKNAAND